MTQSQHSLVSLMLASRGLAPSQPYAAVSLASHETAAEDSFLPTAGIVVRVFAIAALLIAAVASISSEPATRSAATTISADA